MLTSSSAGSAPSNNLPEGLRLIADETRWRLITALRQGDLQVGELTERLGLPQNLVSYHLSALRQGGLVLTHRSDADGRVLYYGLDLAALKAAYAELGTLLQVPGERAISDLPPRTVAFLCTANSARSQMAEAWLRYLRNGRLRARSAGTSPRPIHQGPASTCRPLVFIWSWLLERSNQCGLALGQGRWCRGEIAHVVDL